jgi:hypothetical protein
MQRAELRRDEILLAQPWAHVAEPAAAATGNLIASFSLGSKKVPIPRSCVAATYAFQYGTDPQPVHV